MTFGNLGIKDLWHSGIMALGHDCSRELWHSRMMSFSARNGHNIELTKNFFLI